MFIKFNIKRSICLPDPAIYLNSLLQTESCSHSFISPCPFVWKIPSSGTQSKCFPVPDLQYIKVNLVETTLPKAKAFMWQQFLCGFINGERGDQDEEVKTEEKKRDLTINKCFGKCFKCYHWRGRWTERGRKETPKVNVNNWFVVFMNNISSGVSRARIIITH